MTTEERIQYEVNKRIAIYDNLQKESTQVQIAIEYIETMKTEYTVKWLLSVSDERKNKKLYDCITLLNKRFKRHLKLMNDLKHYEHKATYYEMMYKSLVLVEEQNKILREKLMSKF